MFRAELTLLFTRRRTLGLLAALAFIPILAGLAIYFEGGPGAGHGPPFLNQVTHNGVFLALTGLTVASQFFLPLTVAIVAGDSIAGEASMGTLRYLLARPVGRTRLLGAKLTAALAYSIAAALTVSIIGLLVGAILFPIGPVTTLSGFTISLGNGTLRVLGAALVVGISMAGLAALGLFLSTLTEASVGAMAATAGLFVAFLIFGNLPELASIQPYLFTAHWDSFGDLMRQPATWGAIGKDFLLQAGWAAVACVAAWARFSTADVLA